MKKLLLGSLLMAFITGCCYIKNESTVVGNQQTWSKEDIFVTARLEHKEYSSGEPINLEIIITNNSSADIFFVISNPLKQFKFTVLNKEQNKVVSLTTLGKRLKNQEVFRRITEKIEIKSSHIENLDIKSLFDVSLSGEYSISFEGSYLNNSRKEFIKFKIEDILFSRRKDKNEREK